jgi:hypothetical protein
MTLPAGASRVLVAPGNAYALLDGADGVSVLPLNRGAAGHPLSIDAISGADLVSFSPTGKAATVYSRSAARLQVIGGLPTAPSIRLDRQGLAFGEVAALAVSDDASSVLIAADGAVYSLGGQPAPAMLASVDGAASLAFFRNGARAAIVDGSGAVRLWSGKPGSQASMLSATGVTGLRQVHASADGQYLSIVNPTGQAILRLDTQTGLADTVPLAAPPTRLDELAYNDVLVTAAGDGQPVWLLLQQDGRPVSAMVPAAATRAQGNSNRGGSR